MTDPTPIDPHQLVVPDDRATATYDEGQYEALRESIKADGIRVPLEVVRTAEGLVVTDGYNRTMIAIELGLERVPCIVKEGTIKDAMLDNLAANFRRGKNRPADMAKVVLALQRDHGAELGEISQRTGLSEDWVRKLLRLGQMHPYVRDLVDSGSFTLGVAFALGRLHDQDVQVRVAKMALDGGWTVEYAQQMVGQVLEELDKPPAAQVPLEQVQIPPDPCAICQTPNPPGSLMSVRMCPGCWTTIRYAGGNAQ